MGAGPAASPSSTPAGLVDPRPFAVAAVAAAAAFEPFTPWTLKPVPAGKAPSRARASRSRSSRVASSRRRAVSPSRSANSKRLRSIFKCASFSPSWRSLSRRAARNEAASPAEAGWSSRATDPGPSGSGASPGPGPPAPRAFFSPEGPSAVPPPPLPRAPSRRGLASWASRRGCGAGSCDGPPSPGWSRSGARSGEGEVVGPPVSDRRTTGCGVAPLPLARCDAAWRASAWRHSVSICLRGVEGEGAGSVSGGCADEAQRQTRPRSARGATIWAPRVGGAHLRGVRALEARIVAHARTRTSRRRPRTRHRRRPAGTSPSRGRKGADALPTRARTHGARDVFEPRHPRGSVSFLRRESSRRQ